MIRDLIDVYTHKKRVSPTILQDNYILKEGLYIRLDIDKSWQDQCEDFASNHLVIQKGEEPTRQIELYQWFKTNDYHSNLIEIEKPVDPKKQIHSNNMYTLFAKIDVFLEEKLDAKASMDQNINRYLETCTSDQITDKWVDLFPTKITPLELLEQIHLLGYAESFKYLESAMRRKRKQQIHQWYADNFSHLATFIKKTKAKEGYVKLFFANESFPTDLSLNGDVYEHEFLLYLIPKIFNTNKYNQWMDGQIYGVPAVNMCLNPKKPFLIYKNMRILVPNRVSIREAIQYKEFHDWLFTFKSKSRYAKIELNYPFESPGGEYFIYIDKKERKIIDFENVPFSSNKADSIEFINYLGTKDQDHIPIESNYLDAADLQKMINQLFFRGRLRQQFLLGDPPKVKMKEFTPLMVALFLQSRQAFHDWFTKNTLLSIKGIFPNITLRLIEEQLVHVPSSRMDDLAEAFNLRLSIEAYFHPKGGRKMGDRILFTIRELQQKLSDETLIGFTNDHEFYFSVGQLAHYLMNQSESSKKNGDLYEPFLRARKAEHLKRTLAQAYDLYKHKISLSHRRFNRLMSMIFEYVPQKDNKNEAREMMLAGLFAPNLLYTKTQKGVETNEHNEQ